MTLAEAYQYAYAHTLTATLPSVWGPQHPSYHYRLSGTGDLAITRIDRNRHAISFPRGQGRTYVVSTAADEVMGEVTAQPQGRVRFALPGGRYRVVAREGRRAWLAEVTLGAGSAPVAVLEPSAFREVAPELAFAKGAQPTPRHELAVDVALSGLGPGLIRGTPEVGLGVFRRLSSFTVGSHLSYGATDGDIYGVPYALRRWTLTMVGVARIAFGLPELRLGVGLGVAAISGQEAGGPTRSGRAPVGHLALGVDLPVARWLAIRFDWSGGVALIPADGELSVTPELRASLGVVVRR